MIMNFLIQQFNKGGHKPQLLFLKKKIVLKIPNKP